jgi:hypothetical protein
MTTDTNPIVIDVNEENISQYPPTCFLNPKKLATRLKPNGLKSVFQKD